MAISTKLNICQSYDPFPGICPKEMCVCVYLYIYPNTNRNVLSNTIYNSPKLVTGQKYINSEYLHNGIFTQWSTI